MFLIPSKMLKEPASRRFEEFHDTAFRDKIFQIFTVTKVVQYRNTTNPDVAIFMLMQITLVFVAVVVVIVVVVVVVVVVEPNLKI